MTSQRIRRLGATVGIIGLCVVPTIHAETGPSDQVRRWVEHRLSADEALHDIRVSVQNDEVNLSGTVLTLWARERAINRTREVEGVHTVISHIVIPKVEDDRLLAQDVARVIRHYPYYTVFDALDGIIHDGVVTLSGFVTSTPDKKGDIVRRVSRVPGVQAIHDNIQVLSPSQEDSRLRRAIAGAAFRHVHFQRFATMPTPPFHIVVHNGVVTLVGVVQSEIERRELERIARHTRGVLRVENDLQTRTGSH